MTSSSEQTTALIAKAERVASFLDSETYWTYADVVRGLVKLATPRVVSTVAELDALPSGSVVKSAYDPNDEDAHNGGVWERVLHAGPPMWWPTGQHRIAIESSEVCLPATVLWVGGTE